MAFQLTITKDAGMGKYVAMIHEILAMNEAATGGEPIWKKAFDKKEEAEMAGTVELARKRAASQ